MRALLFPAVLTACAPDEPPPIDPGLVLDWQPCEAASGATGAPYTCARVEVPLRWDRPDDGHIELFVKHRAAARPSGRGVWLLAGGPGQSGLGMEGLAELIAASDDTLDLYMPDHRGTGWSTPLLCPEWQRPTSEAGVALVGEEHPACAAHVAAELGGDLQAFSAREAAADLGALIAAVADPERWVLGVSYGTWWAHRYLELFPDQADGVIFDSMCAPGECYLSEQDLWEDEVVAAWLDEVCGADPACAAALPDPWTTLTDLHARLEGGHCGVLGRTADERRANLRAGLSQMFIFTDLRPAVPALIHRAARCDDDDADAIIHLFDAVFGAPPITGAPARLADRAGFNDMLMANVIRSELWEDPAPAQDELARRYRDSMVGRGVSQFIGSFTSAWPTYEPPDRTSFAASGVPMLMLQSRYDNLTPLTVASPMGEAFQAQDQHFVVFENGGHTVLSQSRRASDPERQCAIDVLVSFLADPSAPDLGCTQDLLLPAFPPSEAWTEALLGTVDLWGG